MKKLTLEKIKNALINGSPVSRVSEEIRIKASKPLDRMLELAQ